MRSKVLSRHLDRPAGLPEVLEPELSIEALPLARSKPHETSLPDQRVSKHEPEHPRSEAAPTHLLGDDHVENPRDAAIARRACGGHELPVRVERSDAQPRASKGFFHLGRGHVGEPIRVREKGRCFLELRLRKMGHEPKALGRTKKLGKRIFRVRRYDGLDRRKVAHVPAREKSVEQPLTLFGSAVLPQFGLSGHFRDRELHDRDALDGFGVERVLRVERDVSPFGLELLHERTEDLGLLFEVYDIAKRAFHLDRTIERSGRASALRIQERARHSCHVFFVRENRRSSEGLRLFSDGRAMEIERASDSDDVERSQDRLSEVTGGGKVHGGSTVDELEGIVFRHGEVAGLPHAAHDGSVMVYWLEPESE